MMIVKLLYSGLIHLGLKVLSGNKLLQMKYGLTLTRMK